jgi:uncharacterized protein YlxW (UPF0749 family)
VSEPSQRIGESSAVALLIDLATNTLDPGYAAAAERAAANPGAAGSGRSRRRRLERIAVTLGCVLAGFILALSYVSTHRSAPQAAKVHADLVARARAAERAAADLEQSAQHLTTQIDALRNRALDGSGGLRSRLQSDQVVAGAVAVTGPGVQVTLANPPTPTATANAGRPGTTPIAATQLLTDRDVRSVVNELWADGAEAISVNDVRLSPTSAIRFAGQAVLVDFEPINAPYVIRAIGNADRLDTGFAASSVAGRYQTLASVRGLGFSFDERDKLALPASTLSGPTYARPAGTDGAAGSTTSSPAPSSTGATK